jgi:cell shape-determining protein MreC
MKVRLRHNSKDKRPLRVVAFVLLIIVIGMLLPRLFSVVSTIVMSPIHATNSWLNESSSLIPTFLRNRVELEDEIKSLKQALVVAERSDVTQQRLWEENNRLRSLLGAASEERIAAAVIARPNELPYDLLQIDRGSNSGVEVGSPVFIGKDVVIGLVVHVATDYSFVQLVTSPGFAASAFISGPNVVVAMEGMGSGVARVRVPQGVPLAIGNLVYLPSVEPGIFGRISYIENRPTQPEQYGYISPDIAISGLYQVAIGKLSQITRSTTEIDERILKEMRTQLLVENLSVGILSSTTTATTTEVVSSSSNSAL